MFEKYLTDMMDVKDTSSLQLYLEDYPLKNTPSIGHYSQFHTFVMKNCSLTLVPYIIPITFGLLHMNFHKICRQRDQPEKTRNETK